MKRIHYLAAEIFSYSYDNYEEHLGVNDRFDKLMPRDARLLEEALNGPIDMKTLAAMIGVDEDILLDLLQRTKQAKELVDAKDPSESFREGVRQSINHALKQGLDDAESIENLVVQICYRAADLGFLLEEKGHRLAQYSRHLRREKSTEYFPGYFEEALQEDNEEAP